MIPPELIKKYQVAGPRYTSYPTVPYWDRSPTESEWISSITRSLAAAKSNQEGFALYIHVPFCESLCTYCGCNNRITKNHSVESPYVETLLKEWGLYLERVPGLKGSQVSEIHLGGGTPTFLSPENLNRLMAGILAHVKRHPDAEFSVEVDPRVTTREHLAALRELGVTRVSLGIQDFDPQVQYKVHREQSPAQVAEVVKHARELGYTSVNFDLIYGLPLQTRESIRRTFEVVSDLRPDRIAYYSYAHVPWIKPGQRRFTEADLPEGDEKRGLYEEGRSLLERQGYLEIGMDHFALPSDSLSRAMSEKTLHRNFMGYISRRVNPLIGIGVSSIGDGWDAFSQNEKSLEVYQSRVEKGELPILRGHVLDDEDLVIRSQILNLMTRMETDLSGLRQKSEILKTLTEPLKDELIKVSGEILTVTPLGRAFLRNICMALDARLMRKSPDSQVFSKTV